MLDQDKNRFILEKNKKYRNKNMQVEITGLEQGSILVEFQVLPREGEYLKIQ